MESEKDISNDDNAAADSETIADLRKRYEIERKRLHKNTAGGLSDELIGLETSYIKNKLQSDKMTNAQVKDFLLALQKSQEFNDIYETLPSVKKQYAKMQKELEDAVTKELNNMRKVLKNELAYITKNDRNYGKPEIDKLEELFKDEKIDKQIRIEKMLERIKDKGAVSSPLLKTNVEWGPFLKHTKIEQALKNLHAFNEQLNVSVLRKGITYPAFKEFSEKLKEFQSIETVNSLQKECSDYKKYLVGIVETELGNVLKDLQKELNTLNTLEHKLQPIDFGHQTKLRGQISVLTNTLNSKDKNINQMRELANEHKNAENKRLMLAIEKLDAVNRLTDNFKDPSIPLTKQVSNFKSTFSVVQGKLEESADSRTEKFLTAVRIALGIGTLGLISKITRGTFKFWQSHDKVSTERMAEKLENTLGRKNKK